MGCREKVGHYFRNALGCLYKSSTKSKRCVKKEETTSRLIYSLHDILFSNKMVTAIMERLILDVTFIDDTFYEKAFNTNIRLLEVFKNDICLVQRYHHQLCLVQQVELPSCVTTIPKNPGNALAA